MGFDIDQGTLSDLFDSWVDHQEREFRWCNTCKTKRLIPDPNSDGNYGSWFIECPECNIEPRKRD